MATRKSTYAEQLRMACKWSGARWVAWIFVAPPDSPDGSRWVIGLHEGLSKARQKSVVDFLNGPVRHEWISGALATGHPRWQEAGPFQSKLGCGRVYLYPCNGTNEGGVREAILAAGSDGLNAAGESMLRLVGMIPPTGQDLAEPAPEAVENPPTPPEKSLAYEQLEALYETSVEITARLELNTLLQRIALRARELVEARGAEVGLIDPAAPEDGFPPEVEQVVRIIISETAWPTMQKHSIPFMTGLAGKIAGTCSVINIADYNEWDGRMLPERFAPFKAAAGVPLMVDGCVIGTLTVLDDRPEKRFSAEDVHILEMFGAQAATAIRSARLYVELSSRIEAQQRAEKRLYRSAQMAALGDISTQIANEIISPLMRANMLMDLVLKQVPEDAPQRTAQISGTALRDLRLASQQILRAREMTNRLLSAARDTQPVGPEE